MQRIVGLMQQREGDYGKFHQIETSSKTPEEVTLKLLGILKADPDLHL